MSKTKLQIVALTDRGMERDHNEDYHGYIADLEKGKAEFLNSVLVDSLSSLGSLLIVADGMGGTNAGEVASKIAVDVSRDFILTKVSALKSAPLSDVKNIMFDAVKKAQDDIVQHQKDFPDTDGMGTTLVLTWIIKNKVYVAWVGDSRCYVFNPNVGLTQLSKDHSYVQELVDAGKITEEQAFYHPQSNIITQSLGDKKRPPSPDFVEYNLQVGDSVVMCSDGLNGMLNDSKMEMILKSTSNSNLCAKILLDEANAAGGHDNITVLIVFAESVNSPLPPSLKKTSQNTNLPAQKKSFTKHSKMFLGVIVGVVITTIILLGIKYIPSKNSENLILEDTVKVKKSLLNTDSTVLKNSQNDITNINKKEAKQKKSKEDQKSISNNIEIKSSVKNEQKDSTIKTNDVIITPIKEEL